MTKGDLMAQCEVCGNDYRMSFEVRMASGESHTFDSIECAAHKLAPRCEFCDCRILGHGMEISGRFYCCAHCARQSGTEASWEVCDAAGVRPGV